MAIVVVIVMLIVVIAVILAVPVPFVDLPALLVVVVVRMGPVSARIGRPLPPPGDPDIVVAMHSPIAIRPGITISRDWRPYFIANRWRCGADVNLNLAECRDCQGRNSEDTTNPSCFQ